MLATSPIQQLVLAWWRAPSRPALLDAQPMREALFAAALQEIGAHLARSTAYDPLADHRFKWAVQHLELIEGTRRHIHPDTHFAAMMLLEATPSPTQKHLAAHDS